MNYPVANLTKPADLSGQQNGQLGLPPLVQFPLPSRPQARLHRQAARAFGAFFAEVLQRFQVELTCTSTPDCYRSYDVQRALFLTRYTTTPLPGRPTKTWNGITYWQKPGTAMAATPGTSNHGWGLAVDVAVAVPIPTGGYTVVGITSRMDVFNWMLLNAFRFGLSWEAQSEPWHVRYNKGDAVPQAVLDYETSLEPAPSPDPPPPPPPTPPDPPPTPPPAPPQIVRTVVQGNKATLRPELRAALSADPEARTDVQLCQILCNGLLGAGLAIDGDFGPHTQAAAVTYQSFSQLEADGVWGPVTWTKVLNLS